MLVRHVDRALEVERRGVHDVPGGPADVRPRLTPEPPALDNVLGGGLDARRVAERLPVRGLGRVRQPFLVRGLPLGVVGGPPPGDPVRGGGHPGGDIVHDLLEGLELRHLACAQHRGIGFSRGVRAFGKIQVAREGPGVPGEHEGGVPVDRGLGRGEVNQRLVPHGPGGDGPGRLGDRGVRVPVQPRPARPLSGAVGVPEVVGAAVAEHLDPGVLRAVLAGEGELRAQDAPVGDLDHPG